MKSGYVHKTFELRPGRIEMNSIASAGTDKTSSIKSPGEMVKASPSTSLRTVTVVRSTV